MGGGGSDHADPSRVSVLVATDQALQPLSAAAVRLVRALVERDGRRSLFEAAGEGGGKSGGVGGDAHWLLPEIDISLIMREYVEPRSKARALLSKMPWLLPFAKRVDVFRELVAAERRRIKGEALPEHLRGHQVKIRRGRILEDGYVQLAGLEVLAPPYPSPTLPLPTSYPLPAHFLSTSYPLPTHFLPTSYPPLTPNTPPLSPPIPPYPP